VVSVEKSAMHEPAKRLGCHGLIFPGSFHMILPDHQRVEASFINSLRR
jgi:hypothetical protein